MENNKANQKPERRADFVGNFPGRTSEEYRVSVAKKHKNFIRNLIR